MRLVLVLLLAFGCGARVLSAQAPPSLVVLITVDQMRADYIARFDRDLQGGFRRLAAEGTYFGTALQDHAMTSTAPGHATLWSGRTPAHTNIISNDLGVPDPGYPLIGGLAGDGASPRRFRGTALVDWLLHEDSGTRVLAVSRKDRGAILSVGAARVPVYWWSKDGGFTTSRYYADTLPTWLTQWNGRLRSEDWERREWRPLLPARHYPEPDTLEGEGILDGRAAAFPHYATGFSDLQDFPWMDSLTLDVALTGIRALGLDRRGGTDVLAVSLSTLDAIGHDYGPDSREVHDHFVRLDRWLDGFFTSVERAAGARGVLFILSSDHGVTSMPELLRACGRAVGRVVPARTVRDFFSPLVERYRYDFDLNVQDGIVLADTVALRARGFNVDSVAAALASELRALPGAQRVHTPATLAASGDHGSAALWRRSIPTSWSWLAAVEPEEGWSLTGKREAEHGTPLHANMEVPLFFMGPGVPARRVERQVRTVDVAPTIAALIGVRPTEPLDGVVLTELVTPRRDTRSPGQRPR